MKKATDSQRVAAGKTAEALRAASERKAKAELAAAEKKTVAAQRATSEKSVYEDQRADAENKADDERRDDDANAAMYRGFADDHFAGICAATVLTSEELKFFTDLHSVAVWRTKAGSKARLHNNNNLI